MFHFFMYHPVYYIHEMYIVSVKSLNNFVLIYVTLQRVFAVEPLVI